MGSQHQEHPKRLFSEDLELVRRMVSENEATREAGWAEFIARYHEKLCRWIRFTYGNAFTDSDIEEIRDGVYDRLLRNDYQDLRKYEGRCSLTGYLIQGPIRWECLTKLKNKKSILHGDSLESLESKRILFSLFPDQATGSLYQAYTEIPPDQVMQLDPERRWVFLLRYHHYFEFPASEVREVAKARKVPMGEISSRLTKVFEKDDVLAKQRDNLEKTRIRFIRLMEKVMAGRGNPKKVSELQIPMVKTPYEAIGYILMVENMNTLRSRFREAQERIKKYLESRGHYL